MHTQVRTAESFLVPLVLIRYRLQRRWKIILYDI